MHLPSSLMTMKTTTLSESPSRSMSGVKSDSNSFEAVECVTSSPALPEEERRLRRKFDFFLLPPLTFMYLCNALDKGNVGNAKTDGWDKDIHLIGNQYYLLVMIFYVPFCLFGTPISLLVKRFSAARILPLMMIGFGLMSLFAGLAKNFSEIFAIRFFLGIFEAPMLPGVVFYLSTFYKRNELASRVGLFYAAASIAGAFSGLIAFGVFHIESSKYHAWQFLFWIEGAGTVFFAVFAFFWLPRSPASWKLLSEREKAIANSRMLADSSVVVDERLDIRDAFRPFKDPMYWIWALISLSFGVPLASVNNFLPQIVASLGYSTIKTNLLTVAPNVVGTVALLLLTFSSDYCRERSIHICIPLATALIGFIILGSIDVLEHRHLAYFACFLLTCGAFAPSVLVSAWYSNNTPSESRRAVVAAVMVAIANSSGLISTNVFRAKDEPKYVPALATSAAFGGFCLILVASMGGYMRMENRRRNKEQGIEITASDISTEALGEGPRSSAFRYMY
ncbi:MFS general substrate transporter [Crucibulum laeve]|uniref:MFS general substrate transporter n=1 Tax=Crucibulum laeve TaxID=68775 RepID=A0A5C3M6W5_9AGAR|nr:MFS general substrate transporter [Crucibulum laeve]